MNSPSWLPSGSGRMSRPWVEEAAADRRWRDTTRRRRWWVNGGATGRSMWYRVPRAHSCPNPGWAARSRRESRARSLRHRARPSWSLTCRPGRNTARRRSAHRREQTTKPGTQSLKEQDRRKQKSRLQDSSLWRPQQLFFVICSLQGKNLDLHDNLYSVQYLSKHVIMVSDWQDLTGQLCGWLQIA